MKKTLMVLAVALCCTLSTLNAQTAVEETSSERYLRLSKFADEHQDDWKAQLEVGRILIDKNSGFHNPSRAVRYYERIYHRAADYNKEVPDSVFAEAIMMLINQATNKRDMKKALFYVDELLRVDKAGGEFNLFRTLSAEGYGIILNMGMNEPWKSLTYMMDMRQRVSENNIPGIEYMDFSTVMLFEQVLGEYKKMFGDKLVEFTIDGKKYVLIAMKDWNIERPLCGWLGDMDEAKDPSKPTLLYGEDGKVYDNMHGEMNFSFFFSEKTGKVEPQEGYNMNMISVTPERRQQMVDAYHNYIKKTKKK